MKDFIKFQLKQKSENLNNLISEVNNDNFSELSFKIKNAQEVLKQEETANKPLIITLLGGSGVGKSYIFSALHGVKELSPSSDNERAFTKKLIISCEETQKIWAPNTTDLEFKDEIYSRDGLMVIDTPDIDSDNINNKKLAIEAVKVSDVVVYVTTPDKKRDFSVLDFLKKWSGKKLWYFVVNKADNFGSKEEEEECKKEFTELLKTTFGIKSDDFSKYVFFFHGRNKNEDEEFLRFQKSLLEDKTTESTEAVHDKEKLNAFARLSDSNNGITLYTQIDEQIKKLRDYKTKLEETYNSGLNDILNDKNVVEEIKNSYIYHFCNAMNSRITFAMAPFFAVIKLLYGFKKEEYLNKRLNEGISNDYKIQKCYSDEKEVLIEEGFKTDSLNKTEKALTLISQNKIDISESAVKEAKSFKWDFKLTLANVAPVLFFSLMLYHSVSDWIIGNWLPTNFFIHGFVLIILSAIIGFSIIWSEISNMKAETLTSLVNRNDKQEHFYLINTAITRLTEIKKSLEDLCNYAKELRNKTVIPENFGLEVK